jgi:hypothetical protein
VTPATHPKRPGWRHGRSLKSSAALPAASATERSRVQSGDGYPAPEWTSTTVPRVATEPAIGPARAKANDRHRAWPWEPVVMGGTTAWSPGTRRAPSADDAADCAEIDARYTAARHAFVVGRRSPEAWQSRTPDSPMGRSRHAQRRDCASQAVMVSLVHVATPDPRKSLSLVQMPPPTASAAATTAQSPGSRAERQRASSSSGA